MIYGEFDDTGRIVRHWKMNPRVMRDGNVGFPNPDNTLLLGSDVDWEEFYVRDGMAEQRPVTRMTFNSLTAIADGITPISLLGIPSPGTFLFEGPGVPEMTGDIDPDELNDFTFDTPGAYRFEIECFPHRIYRGVINVSP